MQALKNFVVTEKSFTRDKVKELNRVIQWSKQSAARGLTYERLDIQAFHLRVYADASFASKSDLSSQLGYIILLPNENGK